MDWTLDDFLQTALQLTSGEGETKQYGYAVPFRNFSVQEAAINFDVQLIDYSEPIPNYDFAAATEMLTWYTDLIRTHGVQPLMAEDVVASFGQFDMLLQEERIAMWSGSSVKFYYEYMPEVPVPRFDLGFAAQPIGPSGQRSLTWVQAFYIFADSSHPEACWEWIQFLVKEPATAHRPFQAYQMLPAHIETAESQAYVDIIGEEIAAIGHAYISDMPPDTSSQTPEWMSPGYGWLSDAYFAVVREGSDVATALAAAEAKFSQYRQCVIEQDAFEDEAAQEACEASVE